MGISHKLIACHATVPMLSEGDIPEYVAVIRRHY